mmetsp:Transcript_43686/g.88356  ORF Transcript_43686/g.88356 Transcript_43686/m.88356 type:complete len:93 (-) Transcript_43686:100-378(-)
MLSWILSLLVSATRSRTSSHPGFRWQQESKCFHQQRDPFKMSNKRGLLMNAPSAFAFSSTHGWELFARAEVVEIPANANLNTEGILAMAQAT